jgi:hypothetical protein
VLLVGLITPFTLMAKLSQGSSQFAIVAQLVEHRPSKSGVAGSNPVYRSSSLWVIVAHTLALNLEHGTEMVGSNLREHLG